MTYYTLDIKGYGLSCGIKDARELIEVRKKYRAITTIKWLVAGVEIDPFYIDCTYEFGVPVLIFLN